MVQKIDKPGTMVKEDAVIRVLGDSIGYVSRGGLKLAKAIKEFKLDLTDLVVADIGASTGGFTDCSLKMEQKSFCYRCRLWTISMVITYR